MADDKLRIITRISAPLLLRLEAHCGARGKRASFIEGAIADALELAEHKADARARANAELLRAG